MDKKLARRIGLRVRTARESRGWTQVEFARRVKLARGYVSDIECGKKEISVPTLLKLCKATDMTPSGILGAIET